MKHIISLAFSSSKNNFETVVEWNGKPVRISQFGADFNFSLMESLIKRYDNHCDVIALSGLHPSIQIGRKTHYHRDSQRLVALAQNTSTTTGILFRNTYGPWAIRNLCQSEMGRSLFENQRIGFLSGLVQQHLANTLSEYSERLYFADPYLHFGIPSVLRGVHRLESYGKRMLPILQRRALRMNHELIDLKPLVCPKSFKRFMDADTFVSSATLLDRINVRQLAGKTLILDSLPRRALAELKGAGIKEVIHFTPDFEVTRDEERLNYATLEALIQLDKGEGASLSSDDILEVIVERKLKPKVQSLGTGAIRKRRKFAFIVHPLSVRDLFRHPVLKPIHAFSKSVERPMEKLISKVPAIKYGKITGIRSESTGEEVEGIIYTLFDTPKQLLSADPQDVYDKLVRVCEMAAEEGCDIIGLGAFTKVVGDAGVTVASRSPIPVTTGNSLSASATLWAARIAIQKLGSLPQFRRGTKINGTAMIVGATGSIGAVSAKLLARVATRLVITAPRPDRLLALKQEIEELGHGTEVLVATDPTKYTNECELIVIATSSTTGDVLELEHVKPGAIICDVGRPLAFSAEQAATRPDVLIIESGEILLPGDVNLTCDIGLDESVVYACLAETALLTLEGRMENFTLSRNISLDKVNAIYDMARKHGAKLATIQGPNGIITDQEVQLCREHVAKKIEQLAQTKSKLVNKNSDNKEGGTQCPKNTSQNSTIR